MLFQQLGAKLMEESNYTKEAEKVIASEIAQYFENFKLLNQGIMISIAETFNDAAFALEELSAIISAGKDMEEKNKDKRSRNPRHFLGEKKKPRLIKQAAPHLKFIVKIIRQPK
jgi:hypothetical protein